MTEQTVPIQEHRSSENLRAAVEAMLFASEKPLLIEQVKKVLDNMPADQVRRVIEELKSDYESSCRGIRIFEVAGGFQMIANPDFAPFLKKLFKGPQSSDKLSKSATETLAIIAYKQPLSKLEIESLRQVNVDGVMQTLVDRSLIRVVGRKKTPGRPKVYGTTRQFLEYFGLKSLEELPKIENFPVPEGALDSIEPLGPGETAEGDENAAEQPAPEDRPDR